jgi:glycosyltransferase involved in cell wall biosynthesis
LKEERRKKKEERRRKKDETGMSNEGGVSIKDSIHTFVIPAFGDSPFIGACLDSLMAQKTKSTIIISTSKPSPYLENIAMKYGVEYVVHSPSRGIGHDWNMALRAASSEWVTLAHQDDLYYPDYGSRVVDSIRRHHDAAIIFSDYAEIVDGNPISENTLLRLKRLLLQIGFLGRQVIRHHVFKRNSLRFGCPIPCPAVTIRNTGDFLFNTNLKVNLDWDAWVRLASIEGSFVWIREVLMGHRVHGNSETAAGIKSGDRQAEDILMLKLFWPEFVAILIAKSYRFAYSWGAKT